MQRRAECHRDYSALIWVTSVGTAEGMRVSKGGWATELQGLVLPFW